MFLRLLNLIFGSKNDRELKQLQPTVATINDWEPALRALSDEALTDKTQAFRKRLEAGETLDDVLPEAFATCREVSRRTIGMRHFDVQLVGGLVLHAGKIAEMKTGEGKTLVATLPTYVNALAGKGVHVVTVNDYLAKRDAQWMGPVYRALGCSVGVIQHEASFFFDPEYEAADKRLNYLRPCTRPEAYRADITYGTNNEFGFDYLRDNLVITDLRQRVQGELSYAIVDEVDSILIDEARTPLIISGPAEQSATLYTRINRLIPRLKAERDYTIEEKSRTVALTEDGNTRVEALLSDDGLLTGDNLYDQKNLDIVHHVIKGLQAHALYKRDVDYVVRDGEVQIVDEFTGRLMPGRRWSDGLHQAVEAKEGVTIANENQTLASITFQNYFRMYAKLAGMTGTADTEAAEFAKIYNLDVNVIPANRPMIRQDHSDVVYRTEKEKFEAIAQEVMDYHERGQPVLVGTISIAKSERLSGLLKQKGVRHHVLNAKFHEKEAEIISQAGRPSAVTLATNMAGRGTDIVLGGNAEAFYKQQVIYRGDNPTEEHKQAALARIQRQCEEDKAAVLAAGGLHIVGTERHESRRIDNQLRGRSGRQGDPGSSRFFLSLEDDLMRIFASERVSNLMLKLGMEEGVPIEHGMVTRSIENAQKKVEAHNFEIRKQILEYDDVMNKQREIIYAHRTGVLVGDTVDEDVEDWLADVMDAFITTHCPEEAYAETWDLEGLREAVHAQCGAAVMTVEDMTDMGREGLREALLERARALYAQRREERDEAIGSDVRRRLERAVILQVVDHHWKEHLLGMDQLRDGIGLRGYGQKDPLAEYKREGFDMFAAMMDRIKSDALERLFKVQVVKGERPPMDEEAALPPPMTFNRGEGEPSAKTIQRAQAKVGRNELCPCGSGKKYKKCHGG